MNTEFTKLRFGFRNRSRPYTRRKAVISSQARGSRRPLSTERQGLVAAWRKAAAGASHSYAKADYRLQIRAVGLSCASRSARRSHRGGMLARLTARNQDVEFVIACITRMREAKDLRRTNEAKTRPQSWLSSAFTALTLRRRRSTKPGIRSTRSSASRRCRAPWRSVPIAALILAAGGLRERLSASPARRRLCVCRILTRRSFASCGAPCARLRTRRARRKRDRRRPFRCQSLA